MCLNIPKVHTRIFSKRKKSGKMLIMRLVANLPIGKHSNNNSHNHNSNNDNNNNKDKKEETEYDEEDDVVDNNEELITKCIDLGKEIREPIISDIK